MDGVSIVLVILLGAVLLWVVVRARHNFKHSANAYRGGDSRRAERGQEIDDKWGGSKHNPGSGVGA